VKKQILCVTILMVALILSANLGVPVVAAIPVVHGVTGVGLCFLRYWVEEEVAVDGI